MAEPESMIAPMLRDMRAEVKRLSEDMGRQFKHGRFHTRDPFGDQLEFVQE